MLIEKCDIDLFWFECEKYTCKQVNLPITIWFDSLTLTAVKHIILKYYDSNYVFCILYTR